MSARVDSRGVIWFLLVLLTVLGATAAVGIAVSDRRKSLRGGQAPKALTEGSGDKLLERTIRDLRVDDVLTLDGKDFLCEGLIMYDEDGLHWLVVGIDRAAASSTRLLKQDDATAIAGYPPEALVVEDVRYVLDKRGAATCKLYGDLGPLGALKKDRPEAHVERCRWWLYSAPGDDTLLVEQFGADYRVLRGKKIGEGVIELIPGS